MKINARLILISFIIVVVISVSYTIIYYSLTNEILLRQHSKTLQISSSGFIFSFEDLIQQSHDDARQIYSDGNTSAPAQLENLNIDFFFKVGESGLVDKNSFVSNQKIQAPKFSIHYKEFLIDNPNVLLFSSQTEKGNYFFYGRVITAAFLDQLSEKIKAQIALVINEAPVEISNALGNESYLVTLFNSINYFKGKKDFEIYSEETPSVEFLATYYSLDAHLDYQDNLGIIIFSASAEIVDLRNTMQFIMALIVISGILLTLIFVLVFTTKLRRQLTHLNLAAEIAGKGNFDHRVTVITKDEVGKLGEAFNHMLDELKKKSVAEKNYSSFIALINQNPSLSEISEVALQKIIESTGFSLGILYSVEGDNMTLLSSDGIAGSLVIPSKDINFYKNIISKKEKIDLHFTSDYPVVKTGLAEIKLKHLQIIPIIFNREVIAILELGAEKEIGTNTLAFIENIQEQLAIGLTNAKAFEQLEALVVELQKLNVEYQRQNKQIGDQNTLLKDLHNQLKEKAAELEVEKEKAEELTKVKSQFLANMSHELRTPLNSILGLTDLVMNNDGTQEATREKLKIVLRNGKRLLILINNILEFSKIEANKFNVKKEEFEILELIEDVNLYISPLVEEKELELNIQFDASSDYLLFTAREMVEQILINLLGNAVKFTKKGKIELKISEAENNGLVFSVTDTGIGISEEDQKIIFEEFRQGEKVIEKKKGGTGLGLAICKRYIDLLGGTIFLKSKLNTGSTFIVEIPSVVKSIGTKKYSPVSKTENTVGIISEDNKVLDMYGKYFEVNNYNFKQINNPDTIIDEVIGYKCVSVLVDNNYKKVNPWELLFLLKSNPGTKKIPLQVFEADFENHKGYMLYPYDYVIEPFGAGEILALINKAEDDLKEKIKSVYFINDGNIEISLIQKLLVENNIELIIGDKLNATPEVIKKSGAGMVIYRGVSEGLNGIKLLSVLRKSHLTRNIPVVVYFSSSDIEFNKDFLSFSLKEINQERGYHPLDTLNIVRKRLNINVNAKTRESLLIEETEGTKESSKQGLEKNGQLPVVLIVDDDRDTQYTVGEIIKELGYKTFFADDGIECLEQLKSIRPELVLLDIMMPRMDGFETIKNIRKDENLKDLKVVALTAYAMLDNKEVIQKNGFDDIITKPVIARNIKQKVEEIIKRR